MGEPSARDRAIEVEREAIRVVEAALDNDCREARRDAVTAIHALLADPGVLRALADTTPAPDVAATEPGTPVFGTGPDDPFRLKKWAALADDVCMFAGCNASETDERGPVWLRGDGMAKACTEHWEPIMRVMGEQASWERDAMNTALLGVSVLPEENRPTAESEDV